MSRSISNPFLTYDEYKNNDYDDVNRETELLIKKPADKNNIQVNDKIHTRAWFVAILTTMIMGVLTIGIINLYQATEIIYGSIGFWAFQIYYIIHVGWYAIFLNIHLFLASTQLFYTMNQPNYINHIILNYGHIWYINFIKLLFGCALVAILYMNSDIATIGSSCIPLYYNLMLIETIASSLLISMTNEIVININTIKLVQETSLV
jgi:hypothetical protein